MKKSVEELKTLLNEGIVNFRYKKVDGSERKASGTLYTKYIPENMISPATSSFKSNNLRYFDLNKKAWRSISGDIKEVDII